MPGPSVTPPALWSDGARRFAASVAVLAVGGIGFGVGYLVFDEPDQTAAPAPSAAGPPVAVETAPGEDVEEIGFPTFATRNTTRVGGGDTAADAAGVALASYPSVGGVEGPVAAVLVPADSWQDALAATPLAADPLAAPVLISEREEVPPVTTRALNELAPSGVEELDGAQVISVGGVASPDGLKAQDVGGSEPAEIADEIDRQRAELTGGEEPAHLLVVSSDEADAALSMPAAAWAARSGDPVLFAAGDEVPDATRKTIDRHPDSRVYVLAPEAAISNEALRRLRPADGAEPIRIGTEDPVASAIEFARFVDGDFGWNINDPGHGFVIANGSRPLDAAAAAPLSAGGKPGPLLITDDSEAVPADLEGFLLDTKPGFRDDPARALYNHVWLIGDPGTISVAFQAAVDELTKLVPVTAGTGGGSGAGSAPGAPEDEGDGAAAGSGDDGGGGSQDSAGPDADAAGG